MPARGTRVTRNTKTTITMPSNMVAGRRSTTAQIWEEPYPQQRFVCFSSVGTGSGVAMTIAVLQGSSPSSLSPPESSSTSHRPPSGPDDSSLPISDNNVSTTAHEGILEGDEWDVEEADDIDVSTDVVFILCQHPIFNANILILSYQIALATAIGVASSDGSLEARMVSGDLSNRLSGKRRSQKPSAAPATKSTVMGDINRSIEKMTLSHSADDSHRGSSGGDAKQGEGVDGTTRRDSNWTNSTEGYGSMKSDHLSVASRRGSEMSAVSQVRSPEKADVDTTINDMLH